MFTSLAFKRPLGFSKTLCTSARFRFVHALSPFVGIGSRHEKGRTLGLGWKGEAAGAQTRLGVRASDPKDLARTFSASDATSTTIKTKFDSIRTPDGLEHPIRDGSRLAWIGVGEAEWRLYLGEKGYVTLMQFQSVDELSATKRSHT